MEPNGMYSSNVQQQAGMMGLEMSLHHNRPPHHPQSYPYSAKPKPQTLTLSDDDEPAGENSAEDGARKMMSPWHRMKWTDNMVRLLIMIVFYIGVEVGTENDLKKKGGGGGGGGGGGALQKKGKWKSVSTAMMERGFYVSPQQCEDKFNDLNKRYKRVNDILGKGIACRVVGNQSLLDSMDHLSQKTKEEVKKLLNSKHLFFKEMCAYHNSCGHGSGSTTENDKMGKDEEEDEEDVQVEEEEVEVEEEEEDEDDEEDESESSRKRLRKETPLMEQLGAEVKGVMEDGTRSLMEKIQWMKVKGMQLEEQGVEVDMRTLEVEKQRLKWLKFSSKKEREMERMKLVQERMKLENQRMVLMLKHKEMDLITELQRHHR